MSLTSLAEQWMKLKNHPALLFLLVVFQVSQFARLVHEAAAKIHLGARNILIEKKKRLTEGGAGSAFDNTWLYLLYQL